jgi:hypothetical protein
VSAPPSPEPALATRLLAVRGHWAVSRWLQRQGLVGAAVPAHLTCCSAGGDDRSFLTRCASDVPGAQHQASTRSVVKSGCGRIRGGGGDEPVDGLVGVILDGLVVEVRDDERLVDYRTDDRLGRAGIEDAAVK